MKKSFIYLSLFVSFLTSCSKGTVSTIQKSNSDMKTEFNEANAALLYTNNCGSCHKLEPREKYTAMQWKRIVPEMAKKAKLSADEESQILQYVLLSSKSE